MMPIKYIAILLSSLILFFVVDLVRREKLTFKYAVAWIGVSMLGIFLGIYDQALFRFAYFLGFELPSNFIFFSLLVVFVFMSLLLTIFLCKQNDRNDKMSQKIALLEFEIEQIKQKNNKSN